MHVGDSSIVTDKKLMVQTSVNFLWRWVVEYSGQVLSPASESMSNTDMERDIW